VETVDGVLRQFLVEPFVPHPQDTEYYININSVREVCCISSISRFAIYHNWHMADRAPRLQEHLRWTIRPMPYFLCQYPYPLAGLVHASHLAFASGNPGRAVACLLGPPLTCFGTKPSSVGGKERRSRTHTIFSFEPLHSFSCTTSVSTVAVDLLFPPPTFLTKIYRFR